MLEQPADLRRFDVTQFRWIGGDNWTDNPTVKVQRRVDGTWQDYADQSGEVQVFLDKPVEAGDDGGLSETLAGQVAYRSGTQEWHWRASFEAFDSYPRADVPGGQVPAGTYRFVVDGNEHTGGTVQPYSLTSAAFEVSPWNGITASDLRRSGSEVSFVVDPITYPYTPEHAAGIRWYCSDESCQQWTDPQKKQLVCRTCSFRPWAATGTPVSATVEVVYGTSGRTVTVPASYDSSTGRWVAKAPGGDGVTVRIPVGGIHDTYGETNGTAYRF